MPPKHPTEPSSNTSPPEDSASALAVSVDYTAFLHHLDGVDLTDAQKHELLQSLWYILCQFAAMGFDVHPVQQAQNSCVQACESGADQHDEPAFMLD